jgi:hypothetical protein
LALLREGNQYRAFHSKDRTAWKSLGQSVAVPMKAPQVGLAVWAPKHGAQQTAIFSDLELRPRTNRLPGLP